MSLLSIENLHITFAGASAPAVDGVNIQVAPGQRVGIIGESGSGKSVSMRALMRLLPERRTRITGTVEVDGKDVLSLKGKELSDLRGGLVSMIFQALKDV